MTRTWQWRRLAMMASFLAVAFCPQTGRGDESSSPSDGTSERYTLRYQFHPGETIRWKVVHRANVKTTISGTTQTAETISESVKVWRVIGAEPGGPFTIEYSVENLDMRQRLTGRKEVRYNSRTDKVPPVGFEDVAKTVGVPLSIVKLDARGNVIERKDKRPRPGNDAHQNQLTVPFPEKPVAVGQQWKLPYEIDITLRDGQHKKIRTRQVFTLKSVRHGIATIGVETQVLTPITDKAVEAQLVQRENAGDVRFDIEAGRVIGQKMELDKHVVGFSGPASSLHYVTRFTEELIRNADRTAKKPKPVAGPVLPSR